jgi:carboxypeptidase Taq
VNSAQKNYEQLHHISRHARILMGISSLLDWDQETHMPPSGAGIRAMQLETLAGIIHEERTSKKFANALSKLIDIKTGHIVDKHMTAPKIAALREWRRDYIRETALPRRFVEELAKLSSLAIVAWRDAKQHNSYYRFAPFLDKIVTMCRKKADFIGYKEHPYDALLDQYEHDITTKDVSKLFSALRKSIVELLKKISQAKQEDDGFLFGKFSQDKQLEFGKKLLLDMGYDMAKGRLDLSAHPFSSSAHPTDSRVTTRIHPTSLVSNIFVILHEGGHALYEMGLPTESYGSPLGESISLGMHESQSRWWETRIGQSKPFWHYYLPLLKKQFKGKLDHVSLDSFYKAINKVEPSFIRVEADEVTYTLHVILRFELERSLIEGNLSVKEIPDAWNAKMKELLGITPKNNAEGCLQDIHWSMGAFGYFPTYALGNLYASHLFLAFAKDHPDWQQRVAAGELAFIREWLSQAVYQHGRRYSSKELLKKVTGKAFSADAFIHYLTNKYSEIITKP